MLIRKKMDIDLLLITEERLHHVIGIMLESVDFKVNLLANGGNVALADHNGIVNGSYSFFETLKVYDCNDANHAVNIKNLLDNSPAYAEKTASKEFFYLDTSRSAEEREFEVNGPNQLAKRRAAYNKGLPFGKHFWVPYPQ